MKNILFVCVGNICRSPIGEGLLKYYAEKNNLDLKISSAGISAMVGWPADPFSIEVAKNQGIDIKQHCARQLTALMLQEADLVLVMEAWHRKDIGYIFPSAYGKVHSLGKWGGFEIPDPYKKSLSDFQETFLLIERGLQDWQRKLWREHV